MRGRIPERRTDNPSCTKRRRGRIWGSRERLASRAGRASRPTWTPCPPSHPLAQPPSQPTGPPSVRSGGSRPQESRAGEARQARVSHSQYPTCCDARKERTVHVVARTPRPTVIATHCGLCSTSKCGHDRGCDERFQPIAALSLKLAMDLARIFDLSVGKYAYPAEAQGKASIPVLAALLTRPDVQDGLLQDAAKWIAGSTANATHRSTIDRSVVGSCVQSAAMSASPTMCMTGPSVQRYRYPS